LVWLAAVQRDDRVEQLAVASAGTGDVGLDAADAGQDGEPLVAGCVIAAQPVDHRDGA
jgi:hypothetical protein